MTNDPIYLDHNATTPLLPEVVDAMLPYLREHFGNPSSGHVYGVRAGQAVAQARDQVARLLGCDPDEVVFTSGGTEANNLAIRGVVEVLGRKGAIVTSTIEHPATARPCAWLEKLGHRVAQVGVDGGGRVRVDEAANAIDDQTSLVTVMHSNNETGTVQPIEELVSSAQRLGALVHTDAAQSVGKVPIRVQDLGVDLLSLAGHKLYAPKGVGALYIKRGTPLAPLLVGANHERGIRPGTENVASIVALGAACHAAMRDLSEVSARMEALRDDLWRRLYDEIPDLALNGSPRHRLPNTLNVRFPRASGTAVLAGAPEVAASTGSACHAGGETASAVIVAMGVSREDALGSVRLSLGRGTTDQAVVTAAQALIRSWHRVSRSS